MVGLKASKTAAAKGTAGLLSASIFP
jgi:hypothetical protein